MEMTATMVSVGFTACLSNYWFVWSINGIGTIFFMAINMAVSFFFLKYFSSVSTPSVPRPGSGFGDIQSIQPNSTAPVGVQSDLCPLLYVTKSIRDHLNIVAPDDFLFYSVVEQSERIMSVENFTKLSSRGEVTISEVKQIDAIADQTEKELVEAIGQTSYRQEQLNLLLNQSETLLHKNANLGLGLVGYRKEVQASIKWKYIGIALCVCTIFTLSIVISMSSQRKEAQNVIVQQQPPPPLRTEANNNDDSTHLRENSHKRSADNLFSES
ncbi:unnamed protein product [Didymodactylos carnosus]|uniref:Uncharacterized protein n=1 Tax=Didymodactylos carnosus TaxID=1234261 RepID=A0A815Q7E4_9BILA|nr:unnamed protein product [Didymodactylos carnosus]CAF1459336.1 unnamed protein product [Didymodactylos carnosus]CAF3827626.1 unnamed protein product [Didymodactylos carnosus]CAF4330064.1 unnamed protein product [Didymodactylos carnosus]